MAGKKGVMQQPCDRSRRAAKILWAAEGYSSVRESMLIAGFTEEESKNRSLQQIIRRLIDKVIPAAVEEKFPSPEKVSLVEDPLTGQLKRKQHWRDPKKHDDPSILGKKFVAAKAIADTPIVRKPYSRRFQKAAGQNRDNPLCLSDDSDQKLPAQPSVSENTVHSPTPTSVLFSPDDVLDVEEHTSVVDLVERNHATPLLNDQVSNSKRRLDSALAAEGPGGTKNDEAPLKKTRLTSHQKQVLNAKKNKEREDYTIAVKTATRAVRKNSELAHDHPNKTTIAEITRRVNKNHGTNISAVTVARRNRKGLAGMSPTKPGPQQELPKPMWEALKGAYVSYLLLEQFNGGKQSTPSELTLRVNACLNNLVGAATKNGRYWGRKVQAETAHYFIVQKKAKVEQRRVEWTTHYNINLWFDTWEHQVCALGFGRLKVAADGEVEGSVVFYDGQLRRILNLDETAASLDNTSSEQGGRPAVVFYASGISEGTTKSSKCGYSVTVICGSNAAGEPLPPHFQLKSEAQDENQRLNLHNLTHCKMVKGQFGHEEDKWHPCTFGLNPKAGMNSVELEKYIFKAIVPLYPDAQDVPGLRVIMKVDSGPGRTNQAMLARLRLLGIYLIPCVPNTTTVTQETDQSFGYFKYNYRTNLCILCQLRFDKRETLTMADIPFLVFGGREGEGENSVKLTDAFGVSFDKRQNLRVWKRVGAAPLTRQCLLDAKVRHEIVRDEDGAIMVDENPMLAKMTAVHEHNKMCCAILLAEGYDGERFGNSPNQRKITVAPSLAITRPLSQEHMDILNKAKTHGQMFHATGGKHLNSDEAFICEAQRQRDKEIKVLKGEKENRQLLYTLQEEAKVILEDKNVEQQGIKGLKNAELLPLVSWKLQKKVGKTAMTKKKMVEAWEQIENPEEAKAWSYEEDKELVELEEEKISLIDTQVGVEANQMVHAIANQMASLGEAQIRILEEAMRSRAQNEAAKFLQQQQERREQRQNRSVGDQATMENDASDVQPESILNGTGFNVDTPPGTAANNTATTLLPPPPPLAEPNA
jgi:hypothetical protein